MAPSVVYRWARKGDISWGAFSGGTKPIPGYHPATNLHAWDMPQPREDPALDFGEGRLQLDTEDNLHPHYLFAVTPDQHQRWFTREDMRYMRRFGFKRWRILVCGPRWIGDTQTIFDMKGVERAW